MHVLVAGDELDAACALATGLREASYVVDVVGTREAATIHGGVMAYDAIVLDATPPT